MKLVVFLLDFHLECEVLLPIGCVWFEGPLDLQPQLLVGVSLDYVGEGDGCVVFWFLYLLVQRLLVSLARHHIHQYLCDVCVCGGGGEGLNVRGLGRWSAGGKRGERRREEEGRKGGKGGRVSRRTLLFFFWGGGGGGITVDNSSPNNLECTGGEAGGHTLLDKSLRREGGGRERRGEERRWNSINIRTYLDTLPFRVNIPKHVETEHQGLHGDGLEHGTCNQ